jgi:hypothetical protein
MFRKSLILIIILLPLLFDMGCKKQKKCGCGKDVIFDITEENGPVSVYYIASSKTAYFPSAATYGSYYYFCNPGTWSDALNTYTQGGLHPSSLIITGKVYYDCSYLMNSSNYGYGYPPQYQVEVTGIKENNYGKK